MIRSIRSFAIVLVACLTSPLAFGQDVDSAVAEMSMAPVFPYETDGVVEGARLAYVDSTFLFALYNDGAILAGPPNQRVRQTLLSPKATVLITGADTILAVDCGSVWIVPIGSEAAKRRLIGYDSAWRSVLPIDRGFAARTNTAVLVHRSYGSVVTDSIPLPSADTYWSVSFDGTRAASWQWGPSTATVQWSITDRGTVDLPGNGFLTCAVLSDSTLAMWNTHLFVTRDRGVTWQQYTAQDIDPMLPVEGTTFRSFRTIAMRGADLYVSFIPERRSEVHHYVSTDEGRTWKRYTPAVAPQRANDVPFRAGIGADRLARGIRFVVDSGRTRIVESAFSITPTFAGYMMGDASYASADTAYPWSHQLDSCIAFDPGTPATSSWIWFRKGLLLVRPRNAAAFQEHRVPVDTVVACWVVDADEAIVRGRTDAYRTTDAGVTWTRDTALVRLAAFTPMLDGERLSLWHTEGGVMEIRSSDALRNDGTLLSTVPATTASCFLLSRSGTNGCVVNAINGRDWTSQVTADLTDPTAWEMFPFGSILFGDSLTGSHGTAYGIGRNDLANAFPRIHEERGWVFGLATATHAGYRNHLFACSVAERYNAAIAPSILPNPATEACRLVMPEGGTFTHVEVYAINGLRLLTLPVEGGSVHVPVHTLLPGVYHVVAHGPSVTAAATTRLVISR